jgi:hypothetical protein
VFDHCSGLWQLPDDTGGGLGNCSHSTERSNEKKLFPDRSLDIRRDACFNACFDEGVSQGINSLTDPIVDLAESNKRFKASVSNVARPYDVTDNSTQAAPGRVSVRVLRPAVTLPPRRFGRAEQRYALQSLVELLRRLPPLATP